MFSVTVYDLWVIPTALLVLALFLLTSPDTSKRYYGFSWLLWSSVAFLVWCAAVNSPFWWIGIAGIIYSAYGGWRHIKTSDQINQESGAQEK